MHYKLPEGYSEKPVQKQEMSTLQQLQVETLNIVDFLPDATFIINCNGLVTAWNRAMEKMTGVKRQQMLGKGNYEYALAIYGVRKPILIDRALEQNELARNQPESSNQEDPCPSTEKFCIQTGRDGKLLHATAAPLYDSQGNLVGAIQSIREIIEQKQMEEALRESEAKFRTLTDTAPALIVMIQNYRYCYVNTVFKQLVEYDENELSEMNSLDLVSFQFRDMIKEGLLSLWKQDGGILRREIQVISKSGKKYWIDFSASFITREEKPTVIITAYDITHYKKIQEALEQSEVNFRQLAETAPALIYVLRGSRLLYVNAAFQYLTGYSEEESLSMQAWDMIHPDNRDWVQNMALARQRGEVAPSRYQARMLKKDRKEWWAEFYVRTIEFYGEPAILGVAIDITERKLAEDQIRYLSYHDKLTGLYNRTYVEEKLQVLNQDKYFPLSVIMGDLNGLKMINDAFGHQQGDSLLKVVANILQACCREEDIVGRWGGDEFIILLPGTDEALALRVCEKISLACADVQEFPVQVSIALGLSSIQQEGENLDEVFKEAEDRMYRNKLLENRSNRSSFLYSLEKTLRVRSHETLEHTERLRTMVIEVGRALKLPATDLHNLTLLAALHDIGKIAIPNSILDKPGPLSQEEWDLMKKHPEIGYRIALSSPELAPIADAILAHHERWDGSGYPLGLRGGKIPLIARIITIADAYDVMLSGRPYQKSVAVKDALEEIARCAGGQFDPDLARLFVHIISNNFQE